MSEKVIGIGFYKREQWDRLLETAVDADIRVENLSIKDSYDFFIRDTFQEQIPSLSS